MVLCVDRLRRDADLGEVRTQLEGLLLNKAALLRWTTFESIAARRDVIYEHMYVR